MFDISNKIIFVSLVVALLCSVVVYYSMRQRINQTEQNMDTMFNLVSSLNDEQKRLGNLVVYSINQQEASAAKPATIQGGNIVDENRNAMEDGSQSSLIIQEIEHSNLINLNDATDDADDEQPTNMINLLLQGQADLRVIVSDDEGVEDDESDDESDDDESEDEEDNDSSENAELKSIAIDESSSDDEDERTVELNKLKVNELKQLLETLDITKGEIAKAKKLKKNELVEFIKKVMAEADAQGDVNEEEVDNNVDEQAGAENVSVSVVNNENKNDDEDEEDDENDEDVYDILEQVANLDDDSDLDDNDGEPKSQSHEPSSIIEEPVVKLNDGDFNNDNFDK